MINNLLIQGAALGTIALVTVFPSPQLLLDAIQSEPTVIRLVPDRPNNVLVEPARYDSALVELNAPFPLDCAMSATTEEALAYGCADDLNHFIQSREAEMLAVGPAVLHQTPDPEVEQARVVLAEICRLSWATDNLNPRTTDTTACDAWK